MAKVHPHQVAAASTTSSTQQVFTLWMKSLIMGSNGCAVFDSDGCIVYRVDNYDRKCSRRVLVMDADGKVLLIITKKRFGLMGIAWEGCRSVGDDALADDEKLGFRVSRIIKGIKKMILGFLKGYSYYKVAVRLDKHHESCDYVMENHVLKNSCCRIVDSLGSPVAEVKRKVTTSGVVLGDDVLTMVVEPNIDHCLIMGLVVVFGLLNHKL